MAKLDELVLELKAKTDGLQVGLQKATGSLQKTEKEMSRTQSAAKGLESQMVALRPIIAAVFSAATIKAIVDAGSQMQQLNARMKALTGSADGAEQAMGRLRFIASKQKVDLLDLADGFSRLLPAVKSGALSYGELEKVLTLANDNIKAFGLNSGESKGLFLGLSQALGSGTVTMEDLRQVTDRLPGTLNAMAKSMGMGVGQFKDFIATGKITTQDILPALLSAFGENAGAAEDMGDTFESAITDMKNALRDFLALFADSGALKAFSFILENLANAMQVLSAIMLKVRIIFNKVTGDTKELATLQGRYAQALDQLAGAAGGATGALKGLEGGKGGIKDTSNALKDAAKQADKLSEGLDNLEQAAFYDQVTQGMNRVEKAVYDVDHAVGKLTTGNTRLSKTQRQQVEDLKDLVRANAENAEGMKAVADAAKEYERQQERLRDALQEPFENAMRSMQNLMADTFAGVFDGSIDSASDAADAMKRIFIRLASEMATLQFFGAQGVPGILGGGGASGQSSGGILDMLSNAPLTGTGVGGFIDDIGQSIGLGDVSGNFTAGAALAGFGGSMAADFLGLSNGVGSSIGSTLGGTIGTAVGGALDMGGPLGAAIGSFLGSAVGGLFGGGKPSSKEQVSALDFRTGGLSFGGLTGDKFSQENQDQATQIVQTLGAFTQALDILDPESMKTVLGGVSAVVNNHEGVGFEFGSNVNRQIGFESMEELVQAYIDVLKETVPDNFTDEVNEALANVDWSNMATALQTLANAGAIDELREAFNIGVSDRILEMTDKVAYETKLINAQFDAMVSEAERLGANVEAVERLRELELSKFAANDNFASDIGEVSQGLNAAMQAAERAAQQFEAAANAIGDTLNDILFGADSALSPEEQYRLAAQAFNETSSLAQVGNLEALQNLPNVVKTFLNESREFNASNADYKADFAQARSALESSMGTAGRNSANQRAEASRISSALAAAQNTTAAGSTNAMGTDAMIAQLQTLTAQQAQANKVNQDLLLEVQKRA